MLEVVCCCQGTSSSAKEVLVSCFRFAWFICNFVSNSTREKCCSDFNEITQVDFAWVEKVTALCSMCQAGQFLALPEYLRLSQLLWTWFIYCFACIQQTSVNLVEINSESFECNVILDRYRAFPFSSGNLRALCYDFRELKLHSISRLYLEELFPFSWVSRKMDVPSSC